MDPALAGRTPRCVYTPYGKVLGSSLNPTADGSYALRKRSWHQDTSNRGAKFHRLGRYYSCSEMNKSIKEGKAYDKFKGELKRWFFS